jgi:peroxiredoxin
MAPLGFIAPDFTLLEPSTKLSKSLQDIRGPKGTLVIFSCNHCPFVLHIEDCLVEVARKWLKLGIGVVAISANDIASHPQDGPEHMAQRAATKNYPFPYLYDQSQEIAKAYQAACTPDFFLFDQHLQCVYRGQFDDSRPGNDVPVSGASLNAAIHHLLDTGQALAEQKASIGCNIKWH